MPSCHCTSQDERRPLEPRDPPQRREIRDHPEVAVAAFPARDRVPRDRVHLHLEREQVVAALDRMARADLVDEELAVQPLAQQAALHVGERDHDGVDRTDSTSARSSSKSSTRAILMRVPSDTLTTLLRAARNSADTTPSRGGLMEPAPPAGSYHTDEDERTLHRLGYAQELFRRWAVPELRDLFTIISILAGA